MAAPRRGYGRRLAHNEVMVIDGETVLTGSFNFTTAAEEHNAENLLVIRDKAMAARYAENWKLRCSKSGSKWPWRGSRRGQWVRE